jgi:Cu/Ag efflux pump CusA
VQVALENLANIRIVDGPAQISRELAKRRVVVAINVKDRDLGGFVAELQKTIAAKVELKEGYYLEWGGQFQNLERAMGHLTIIIPVTVGAIFFLLFLLFGSLKLASLIILVLPFASVGGVLGLLFTANTCRCRPRWASSPCGDRGAQRGGAGHLHPHLRAEGMPWPRRWCRARPSVSAR